jgi:hypothetical protein
MIHMELRSECSWRLPDVVLKEAILLNLKFKQVAS